MNIELIKKLIEEIPNDQELGKAIRKAYNSDKDKSNTDVEKVEVISGKS